MAEKTERTLWLIRHAAAEASVLGQGDARRVLSAVGLADVRSLQSHLEDQHFAPAQWLWVSPAKRAVQTAKMFTELWRCDVIEEPSLYLADIHTLLDCLRGTPDDCTVTALIGHNPGISELAQLLVDRSRTQDSTKTLNNDLPTDLPTLGAVQMSLSGAWSDLRPQCAASACYLNPAQLRGN